MAACGRSPEQRITDAGATAGQARDTAVKTSLPSICGEDVPHASLKVGMELSTYAGLEGHQLDVANKRLRGCNQTGNKLLAATQVVGKATK